MYGTYLLTMQTDGNLVEYNNRTGKPIWASNTWGHPGAFAVLQNWGNLNGSLVVFADQARTQPLWSSGTPGSGATEFAFQGDGNLVLYRSNGTPVWASNTVGK